ncbi:MAG: hydrogenase iron-sulfur subunit [Candidatus Magnetominusculus sp. LBB02]|nr:hydrogenase iron-sulfur subunit [Candidatus Magnetominusculus sp. LBB02]
MDKLNKQPHQQPAMLQGLFHRLSSTFSRAFSYELNPLYWLGAIAIFLLVLDVISGIYLYIFYKIDPRYCYSSVAAISSSFLGNLMRGLHRYTSAGIIFIAIAHMVHVLVTDRFRSYRWVAWITGLLGLGMFLAIGISGYILVWDAKAQLIGILSGKFLSYLPVFGHSIMSTFFGADIKLLGGMFRMILYFHVAITLAIVFVLWIHVLRNARPRIIPPKYLWASLTVYFVLLSIFLSAKSNPEASLSKLPFNISLDWAYFFVYPLMKLMPLSTMWLLVSVGTLVICLFPWIIRGLRAAVVTIDKDKCVGCERCYMDCPYEAVIMQRTFEGKKKAVLNENKCASCAICIGSCSFKAITMPGFQWQAMLDEIKERSPEFVLLRCTSTATPPERNDVFTYTVPCIGSVHPNFPRDILATGVKGVMLVGCEQDDCHYREGGKWAVARYNRQRKPYLNQNVDPSKIRILMVTSNTDITQQLNAFIKDVTGGGKSETVAVRGLKKLNYAVSAIVLLIPVVLLFPLTDFKMAFYPTDKSAIVLSFKYRSTPSVASARSPIKVDITVNQKQVYSKVFNPRGIRRDSAIFVYDEVMINPEESDIKFKIEETLFPEKRSEIEVKKQLNAKDSIVITYDESAKNFLYLK